MTDESAPTEADEAGESIDCDVCGSPLEFKIGDITSDEQEWATDGVAARTELLQRCTNPECPTRGASDLAPAADPVTGAQMHRAVEGKDTSGL